MSGATLTGESLSPGWLLVPADAGADWVRDSAAALRAGWGRAWQESYDRLVPMMLDAATEHRREEDALFFQLWPTDAPVCVFVHAAVGRIDAAALPAAPDAIGYEATGLGPGLQVPFTQRVAGADVWGVEYVFHDAGQGVTVHVEPTLPEILAPLMPMIHQFVQSLQLTGADGRPFAAVAPPLPENGPDGSWRVA